jgi:hypothetical protein
VLPYGDKIVIVVVAPLRDAIEDESLAVSVIKTVAPLEHVALSVFTVAAMIISVKPCFSQNLAWIGQISNKR